MSNPIIKHARIDNRLVHGQGASWVGAVGANLVIVVDDDVASSPIEQSVMKIGADSAGFGIRFFTIQKAIAVIGKASARQHLFITTKTPSAMRALVEGGVPIKEVNVGNMHPSDGKHVFYEQHVFVDQDDLDDLKAISDKGVDVYIQLKPVDRKYTNLDFSK